MPAICDSLRKCLLQGTDIKTIATKIVIKKYVQPVYFWNVLLLRPATFASI